MNAISDYVLQQFADDAATRPGKDKSEVATDEIVMNSRLIYNNVYRRRFFDAANNPRLARPIRHETIRLYHYTTTQYIDSILEHGINRGDVPVHITPDAMPSPDCFNNAVWLSDNLDVNSQKWGGTKCQVRIEIVLNAHDANLWKWADLAKHLGVDDETRKVLRRTGGEERDWWVYVNEPLTTTCFRSIQHLTVRGEQRTNSRRGRHGSKQNGHVHNMVFDTRAALKS